MPIACMESVHLLLALAAAKDWRVNHLDVKSAFLNGELAETVFVRQPPGFAVKGEEHRVLRLCKALYGLRQAPRAWNAKLDATLGKLGFQRYATKHELFLPSSPRVCGRLDRHWRACGGHRQFQARDGGSFSNERSQRALLLPRHRGETGKEALTLG